jgi:Na+/H+ antiporter NhaD/arsenite permease-like protein
MPEMLGHSHFLYHFVTYAAKTGTSLADDWEIGTDELSQLHQLPLWSVIPFILMLLSIAIFPLAFPKWWHHNKNRALLSALLGIPMLVWMFIVDKTNVFHTAHEYVAFILLLGSLYIISGGIVIRGTLTGTPALNTVILAIGAVLASWIGTTGASMLLIRPLLRANVLRKHKAHSVVFFIFIVSNIGGLLTPLGDPPLFLGFLRGVPFHWTFALWPYWLGLILSLLILYFIIDTLLFRNDDLRDPEHDLNKDAQRHKRPLTIVGKRNFIFLGAMILLILAQGFLHLPEGIQEVGMVLIALLAYRSTPREFHKENDFSWGPIVEVVVVFAGIFATMIPALALLNQHGKDLGLTEPWHFFWATGILSSFLDNAPTYLTFTSTASGLLGTNGHALHELVTNPHGAQLLKGIALGAVCMGANTYIGNGPNFMVKAIAEESGTRMPSFFGYMLYSALILIPLFLILTCIGI